MIHLIHVSSPGTRCVSQNHVSSNTDLCRFQFWTLGHTVADHAHHDACIVHQPAGQNRDGSALADAAAMGSLFLGHAFCCRVAARVRLLLHLVLPCPSLSP